MNLNAFLLLALVNLLAALVCAYMYKNTSHDGLLMYCNQQFRFFISTVILIIWLGILLQCVQWIISQFR